MLAMIAVCMTSAAAGAAPLGPGGCPPCPLDWDQSGGVDGDDIAAFIRDWEMGVPCADFDGSGGVDIEDLAAFFDCWMSCAC